MIVMAFHVISHGKKNKKEWIAILMLMYIYIHIVVIEDEFTQQILDLNRKIRSQKTGPVWVLD